MFNGIRYISLLPVILLFSCPGALAEQLPGAAAQPLWVRPRIGRDERCWVKISCAERLTESRIAPYDDVVPFARALVAAAPDRILWGTDWPHPNLTVMPDEGELLDLLADFVPDETTRNRILVDNPARLYPFD